MISHMLHRRDADQAPIIATDMPLAEQIIVWCVYVVYLFFFCFKPNILGLGRPLITLIGASVVVLVRDLSGTPADLTALHYDVLLYLFGLMLFSHYMTLTGVMRVPMRLFSLTYARFGSHGLLWALSLCTGIIAMFFTNDMAVFLLTPVTVKMCASLMPDAGRRVVFLFLMALSTTANVASAMSPIGNPQNVLVATLSGIAPGVFWRFLSLGTVICWVLNTAALSTWLYFVERRKSTSSSADGAKHVALEMSSYERVESQDGALSDAESDANTIIFNEELSEIVFSSRTLNILSCITVTVLVGWVILVSIADVYLGWTTVLAALIIVVAHTAATRMVAGANTGAAAAQAAGVTVFADARVVDFGLLFMFWGNFVLIASLLDTGWPQAVFDALIAAVGDSIVQLWLSTVFVLAILVASNILTNVSVVLLLGALAERLADPSARILAWLLIAFSTTVAGNLTLVGSACNLIVDARSRAVGGPELTFVKYFYYGFPSTVVLSLIGMVIIILNY